MTVSEFDLAGLTDFLTRVGASPDAPSVAEILVTETFRPSGALASFIAEREGSDLLIIGSHGYSEQDMEGFHVMPIGADLPVCHSVRDGVPLIGDGRESAESFSGLAEVRDRWDSQGDDIQWGSIVSVPLMWHGMAIGAYGLTCRDDFGWGPQDVTFLDAVGRVLALWLIPGRHSEDHAGPIEVELSPRQLEIVRLICLGKTNPSIAVTLGFSESLVKQDVAKVMRLLSVRTRRALIARVQDLGLDQAVRR